MTKRDIIVIGASAGGVAALKEFVKSLPADFGGSVFIVLHIPAYSQTRLPWILDEAGALNAILPQDGDPILPGNIYIATNDHHMILEEGRIIVRRGPKENRFRPSIDALFRSAAYIYRERVIGIILSGMLDDGTSGAWTIKQNGGVVIVQLPEEAEQPQLPNNVLEYVEADYVIPVRDMAPIILGMIQEEIPASDHLNEEQLSLLKMEIIIATQANAFEMGIMSKGELTPFTCPECHGVLVRLIEGNILRFRCHTGHAYTANSLLAELTETIEKQLWASMRGLEETNMLLCKISEYYDHMNQPETATLFRDKAKSAAEHARILHDSVLSHEQYSGDLRHDRLNKK